MRRALGELVGELDQEPPVFGRRRHDQDVLPGVEQLDRRTRLGEARQARLADLGHPVPDRPRVVLGE